MADGISAGSGRLLCGVSSTAGGKGLWATLGSADSVENVEVVGSFWFTGKTLRRVFIIYTDGLSAGELDVPKVACPCCILYASICLFTVDFSVFDDVI